MGILRAAVLVALLSAPARAAVTYLDYADVAPSTASQTENAVPLVFFGIWAEGGVENFDGLIVDYYGDAAPGRVTLKLYRDVGSDGVLHSTDTLVSSGTVSDLNFQAVFGFPSETLTTTTNYYFIAAAYENLPAGGSVGALVWDEFSVIGPAAVDPANFPLASSLTEIQIALYAKPAQGGYAAPTASPNHGGFDTGLFVNNGQKFIVHASGSWDDGAGPTTAAGHAPTGGLAAGVNLGALIGRVGGDSWFLVTSGSTATATGSGPLFLAMNDSSYTDNSGLLSVTYDHVPAATHRVWIGGTPGLENRASVNSNWQGGVRPFSREKVFFGAGAVADCHWDIPNMELADLHVSTSFNRTLKLVQAGGYNRLIVSSHVTLGNGVFSLGDGNDLELSGRLTVLGGATLDMGDYGGLFTSGVDVHGTVRSTSTGGGFMGPDALGDENWDLLLATHSRVNVGGGGELRLFHVEHIDISSGAIITKLDGVYVDHWSGSDPVVRLQADLPAFRLYKGWHFDIVSPINVGAGGVAPGSTITFRDATGPHRGSLFEQDPNQVVRWDPDGGGSGEISGQLAFAGGGAASDYNVLVTTDPFGRGALLDQTTTLSGTPPLAYTFDSLPAPNTYFVFGWKGGLPLPSGTDPRGGYNNGNRYKSQATFVPDSGVLTSRNVNIDSWFIASGSVTFATPQVGLVRVQSWNGIGPCSTCVLNSQGVAGSTGAWAVEVPRDPNLDFLGFVDVNQNGFLDPFEARGSSVGVDVALGDHPGIALTLQGGALQPGGTVYLTVSQTHGGQVRTYGDSDVFQILAYADGPQAQLSSIQVEYTGQFPQAGFGPRLSIWEPKNPPETDVFKGEAWFDGGLNVTTATIAFPLPDIIGASTRTYIVRVDHQSYPTPFSGLRISSTANFSLAGGQMAQQGGYPFATGPLPLRVAVQADIFLGMDNTGGNFTGIEVFAGQTVSLAAFGSWTTSQSTGPVTAAGEGPTGLNTVLPQARTGELIGRIQDGSSSDSSAWFRVGASTTMSVPKTGFLYLGINDFPGAYYDNSGEVFVSHAISGSTTGAIGGTMTYEGEESGTVIIEARRCSSSAGCDSFSVMATTSVAVSAPAAPYPYILPQLPPGTYEVAGSLSGSSNKSGRTVSTFELILGSTVTADFRIFPGTSSIMGAISYNGVMPFGDFKLAVTTSSHFEKGVNFLGGGATSAAGGYTIPGLLAPASYFLVAFRDGNFNGKPDGPEPFGYYGTPGGSISDFAAFLSTISVSSTSAASPINVTLNDMSSIAGEASFGPGVGGLLVVEALNNGKVESRHFSGVFPHPVPHSQPYSVPLIRPSTNYSVFAYLDADGNGQLGAGEPFVGAGPGLSAPAGGELRLNLALLNAPVPDPPGSFSALSKAAGVEFQWKTVSGANQYRLLGSTGGALIALQHPATSYLDSLPPDTSSQIRAVEAVNFNGRSSSRTVQAAFSLAAAPAGLSDTNVGADFAFINWGSANPVTTVFEVHRATDANGLFVPVMTAAAAGVVDQALAPASTYFWKVRALNGNMIPSAFSNVASTVTLPSAVPSIAGLVSYPGKQPGLLKVHFSTMATMQPIVSISTLPAAISTQAYYSGTLTAASYFARGFIDVDGDNVIDAFEDKSTVLGPIVVGAAPVSGVDFAVIADTVTPAAPNALKLTPGFRRITVGWAQPAKNSDGSPLLDLRGFVVQRATFAAGLADVAVLGTAATFFIDAFPALGMQNFYRVQTLDLGGNRSQPTTILGALPGLGGSISGSLINLASPGNGAMRVRLSTISAPNAQFIAESALSSFTFGGLPDGAFFLRGFRDQDNDLKLNSLFEPSGTHGGLNSPYPIVIAGGNAVSNANVTVCDRTELLVSSHTAGTLIAADCPALDKGPGHNTDLYSFEAGGGKPGSLGVGSRVSITLSSSFDNELIVLGPDGRIAARDNRPGGVTSVELTLSQPGVYLVEPTSFNPGATGGYSVVMHVLGGFAGQIDGAISYSGSQAGAVHVQLFNNPDSKSSPIRVSTQASVGAYSVTGLFDGFYYVRAFRDANGNFTRDPGEAQGVFGVSDSSPTAVMIQGGVAFPQQPKNITLVDPVVGAVKGIVLYEGTKPGAIRVEAGHKDPFCQDCAEIKVPLSFASTTTGSNYFLDFLPPATDYIVQAYVDANGNKDMDPLEPKVIVTSITVVANSTTTVGLVILEPGSGPSGSAVLRGSITYQGSHTGQVWMGLARDQNFSFIDYVTILPSTGNFLRTGLKGNATYFMVAFMDVNGNGEPEERQGEPIGVGYYEGYAGPPASMDQMVPIYLPLAGSVTAFLELRDSPTGRLNGRITYEGAMGPPTRLIVEAQSHGGCTGDFCRQQASIALQTGVIDYPYSLQFLAASSSFTVRAHVDANGNNRQDFGEPYGQFGFSSCNTSGPCFGSPVAVSSGPGTFPTYGVNFNVNDAGSAGGQFADKGTIQAEAFYMGVLGGPLYFRIFPNNSLSGSPLFVIRVPETGSPAPGPGDFKLVKPGLDFGSYSVDVFRDPGDTGVFNPLVHPYQDLGSVTLGPNNTRKHMDGPVMTDPSGGGSVNVFTGAFAAPSGARFDGGATDLNTSVVIDSVTAGGPYVYVSGLTTQAEGAKFILVRYDSAGVMIASATVDQGGSGNVPRLAFAPDLGKLFSGSAEEPSFNEKRGSLQRYSKELALEQTVFFSSSDVVNDIAYYDGSIYVQVGERDGPNTGTHLRKLTASTLVQTATGTFIFPGTPAQHARTMGMSVDGSNGDVYAAVASSHDEFGALKMLLKYGPNLDASGAPLQADITGLPFARDLQLSAGAGGVVLGMLSHDKETARLRRYNSSMQSLAEAPALSVKASLGTGLGNLRHDTSGYVYAAWQSTSNGGDCFVGRYDLSTMALVNSRTYDGLDNTRSDSCFSLAVLDSTNVFVAATVDNSRNLDLATLRLNLSDSGSISAPGQAVTITTTTATRAIWGEMLYSGAQASSGTLRAFLVPEGGLSALRVSTAAFGARRQYLFNALPDGVYHLRAFLDRNDNLTADVEEPVVYSTASGIAFSGATMPEVNFQLCDRLQLSTAPVTAALTASDCRSWDKGGAFQKMYTFSGRRGQAVTITMIGVSLYDTYLTLYDDSGDLLTFDDESAGDGNARLANFVLPRDGLYTVGASAFAPGITGSYRLEFGGSAGTLGSISGDVEYTGSQGGQTVVGLFSSPVFSTSTFVTTQVLAATRAFTFGDLATGVTYYLGAFIDVNFSLAPEPGEDGAVFGTDGTPAPIYLQSAQALTGVKVLIESSTSALASQAFVNGEVLYAGTRTGPVRLEFWSNAAFSGRPVAGRDLTQGPGFYDVGVPGGIAYFVRAFLDVNNDFLPGPDEPKGVYSPSNQGAESIFAPAGGAVNRVDVILRDPGFVNGTIAGEGSAAIIPAALGAGDGVYSATITFVAGPSGILQDGRVGFTMPPGFPMPQSVVANSTVGVSAVQFSGPSAFVTVTGAAGFGPGHVLEFVLTDAFSPCQVGPSTVTVSSVRSSLAPPQPLFGGSPVIHVAPGAPRFFQPANPYFSLRAGQLSEPQRLELRDGCGNKTPATAPETAEMRAKKFDFNTYQFVPDADLGLSTSPVVSTTSAVFLPFAVGQSSHPFFAVSATTGFKSIELFFDIASPTTFYNGLTVLSANALTQVRVATAPAGVPGSSVTIGAQQQAYLAFQLEDPNNGWRVLVSSMPFKPGVEPAPVWERWGFGQPASGEIAWDGRFSPWINGGARVPNGLYYVRVEIGGSGVRDDRLRILVNVPQVAGRVFDAGVIPNPPLSSVRLQAYGPNGFQTAGTDANGRYVLAGLGAGVNKLLVSLDDYLEGSFNLTVTAGGTVSTFTALSGAVSGSLNGSGGIDVFMNRAPSLRVVPSLDVAVSTRSADAWGSLQVRSSTSAAVPLQLYSPLRLPAGTTTFDDGGQWDPATRQFVTRTQFKFNVAAGTYNVSGFFPGLSIATGAVFVPTSGATLALPPFTRKGVVSGLVNLPSNPQGTFVSVNAVPLSTAAAATGGFGGVFLDPGQLIGTYTVAGLDAGSYILRANAQGFVSLSSGPIAVTLGAEVSGVDFPVFGTGAAISGNATIDFDTTGKNPQLFVSAWSPGSLNFGSTQVYVTGGAAGLTIPYVIAGLTPGATYQIFADLADVGDRRPQINEPLPLLQPAPGAKNFTFVQSSGVILGTILLPEGNTDFINVILSGKVVEAAKPEEVGHEFVEVSTKIPNFLCQPSNSVPLDPGYCGVGDSTGTFTVTGEATETLDLTFFYRTTGQSVKRRLSVVSGSTSTIFVDLTGSTFAVSGTINNQITNALFNTNVKLAANAPYIAPAGWPAHLSSSTARVLAIRQDITDFRQAVSGTFDESTTRVGYIAGNGTFTITNVPSGVYMLRTANLRSCATCPIVVPSVSRLVRVSGSDVADVSLTLSDGYSVSGSISLDGGLLDSRALGVTLRNRRQEVVRSTIVYIGDPSLGLTANSASYSFDSLPADDFYTLTVLDAKYAGRPLKFPEPGLSPNGLASHLTSQNVTLQRAAYLVGRLKDGITGELIGASNAGLLAPNFRITATANPWIEGGFAQAASSVAGRPIEADGFFRVGPLIPGVAYDMRLAQTSWDSAFLSQGSQNYTPVQLSGLTPGVGEVKDVGVVSLHQGQSLTGVVRQSTSTGQALGGIKILAKPSFGDGSVNVQTYTNAEGKYTLWVSSYLSKQFDVTAAPREGNLASNGLRYGELTIRNVSLLATTTADFLLEPLIASVTGQVVVVDGELSYPFGDQRGFPAAAINLQPSGVVPARNPLGDIEAITDARGFFTVPGLSTGVYTLRATSLGYSVYATTISVNTSGASAGIITLQRGATVTGRILKSDGSSPASSEVGGVAAANFGAGEFVIGSVEIDPVAKTASAYSISGFKPGVVYDLFILPADQTDDVSFPPEGDDIVFSAAESTSTKNINLTFAPSGIDCASTVRALGGGQFQLKIDCTKPLRNTAANDNDLDVLLTLASGTGQLLGSDKSLSGSRRRITAIYRAAALETSFSVRLAAAAATVDPKTGENFAIDKTFTFFTGVDANVVSRVANINGGSVAMQPSAEDELLGLDERSRLDLRAGTFALESEPNVAAATISVSVGMRKGKDQQTITGLYLSKLGYAPASVGGLTPSAFPSEMAAAMSAYRVAASTKIGGANPLSSFYDIFLPAGIRHQLQQLADLTLSYDLSQSTGASTDDINVWFFNASTGRFQLENANRRIDTVNKTITVSVDHFSTFVVLDSTPVVSRANPNNAGDISVANFPNPADCITHSNISINSIFAVGGVHPPFKGTMIRFTLPGSTSQIEEAKINIYNLAGELVKTINPGPVAGQFTHYVPWDCSNGSGETVASGVYLGEVRWAGRSKFVKIAIIKGSGL